MKKGRPPPNNSWSYRKNIYHTRGRATVPVKRKIMEQRHTIQELQQWQSLPLNVKVSMTKERIRQWVNHYGEDGIYVSFSGGKDSTVLLHIVREDYPNVKAVFVDTGLEYPEIREFVKTFKNVEWLRPEMNFRQVIEKYGYPLISKQVSKRIYEWDNAIRKGKDVSKTSAYLEFHGERMMKNNGCYTPIKSFYNKKKWLFLTQAPFRMSHKCCDVMKKKPLKALTGKNPITAQMACESINRASNWLQYGCNAFDSKRPISNPMAFWTEQDVLMYIKQNNIPICSVYGDVVEDTDGTEEVDGQLTISDLDGFRDIKSYDAKRLPLKTTGCSRTGCMFCGYGCHLEKPGDGRFERMRETHPKQYDYIMRPRDRGGLGYKEVIDWINEHGNLNIRY